MLMNLKELGKTLKLKMVERDMTQEDVRDLSGCSINTIRKVFAGSDTAQVGKYAKVANALGGTVKHGIEWK
jgi:Helix-turn-helix.